MAQTNTNIRMDEDLEEQSDAFRPDIGIGMSTAFCALVEATVRERRIPLGISAGKDPFYSAANMTGLRRSITKMGATGGTVHEAELDNQSVGRRCVRRF